MLSVDSAPQQRFACINCQTPMRLDPSIRNHEEDKRKPSDLDDGLEGKSLNLLKIICDIEVPQQAPVCKDCSDELMKGMDRQLEMREEECLAYRKLIDNLRTNFSSAGLSSQRQNLRSLQDEEASLESELQNLLTEEKRVEDEYQKEKKNRDQASETEKRLWMTFRDSHRRLLDLGEKMAKVDAELRYAERQHQKLEGMNVLDLTFHIWVDSTDGTMGEINGFRLGRLPDRPVDWLEINAAWGQVVLLLDVLMQRANVKQDIYKLVAMGSHSCIKVKKSSGELIAYPLYSSGSWKPFGNNNMDSGITVLLQCYELLINTLMAQDTNFRVTYRVSKDRLVHNNMEYSAKMLLNSEERWTKAMKMLLVNLKAALVQVVSAWIPT